jgi:tape measure domain-containing protein
MKGARKRMARGKPVGSFYVQLGLNTKEFRKGLQKSQRQLRQAFGSASLQASQNLVKTMAAVGAAFAVVGAASVKLSADLEVQEKSFERLLGSADAAQKKLSELKTFDAETPFTFTELTAYTKRLLGLGFQASETKQVLTTLGDAASGLGIKSEGMGRLIKAFGDIRSKGVLATQEIKQLAENGIPAFEVLANKLGVTIPEAMKMIEDRAIDSTTAINALMDGMNERFGGMMAIQSETMIGLTSSIKSQGTHILTHLGKIITKSLNLHSVLRQLRDGLNKLRIEVEEKGLYTSMMNLFGTKMKVAVIALSGAITASMLPALIKLGTQLALILVPLKTLILAGAVVGGLVGIGAELKNLANETKKLAENAEKADKALSKTFTKQGAKLNKENILALQKKIAYLRTEKEIQADIVEAQKEYQSRLERSGNRAYGENFSGSGLKHINARIQQLQAEKKIVVDLKREANYLKDIYREQVKFNDKDFQQAHASGRQLAASMREGIASIDLKKELAAFFPNLMGAESAKETPKGSGGGPNPLVEEAKQTSQAIEQAWIQTTKTAQEQLDYEFAKELELLNRSKKFNQNYQQDLLRLSETYSQKGYEIEKERSDKIAQDKVAVAQWEADSLQAQIEAENQRAEVEYQHLMDKISGRALESTLAQDYERADLESYIEHLNEKAAQDRAYMEGRRELMDTYNMFQREAYRSDASKAAEAYQTAFYSISDGLTNMITGTQNLGDAFKNIGLQLVQMVVRWTVQQKLAHTFSESIKAASTASSVAQAAVIAAAWAPAAMFVNMATMGGAAGAARGMMSLASSLSPMPLPTMFAEGGIVTKPTLAMIGEAGEAEAVIPLSKLNQFAGSGGAANVQLNVINESGQPVNARTSQHFDGRQTVVNLWLSALNDNVGGLADVVRGR